MNVDRNQKRELADRVRRELIEDGHARAEKIEYILNALKKFRESCVVDSEVYRATVSSIKRTEAILERIQKSVRFMEEASAVTEESRFAMDWIILHGISRGMPQDWNKRGTLGG